VSVGRDGRIRWLHRIKTGQEYHVGGLEVAIMYGVGRSGDVNVCTRCL